MNSENDQFNWLRSVSRNLVAMSDSDINISAKILWNFGDGHGSKKYIFKEYFHFLQIFEKTKDLWQNYKFLLSGTYLWKSMYTKLILHKIKNIHISYFALIFSLPNDSVIATVTTTVW